VKELQERLTELEIRFTHQARHIEELNGESLAPIPTESPDE
jgi:uncharacterized coiled-coil protein SlyX